MNKSEPPPKYNRETDGNPFFWILKTAGEVRKKQVEEREEFRAETLKRISKINKRGGYWTA